METKTCPTYEETTRLARALQGAEDKARHNLRDAKGAKFVPAPKCDGCGKPVDPARHYTDSDVCGNTDGPGFHICHRARCGAKLANVSGEGGIPALRAHYTAQRARNEA